MYKDYELDKDEILAYVNKDKKESKFADISEWERSEIRKYLDVAVANYEAWKVDGKLRHIDTGEVIIAKLKIHQSDSIPLQSKEERIEKHKIMLNLHENQITKLRRIVAYNAAVEYFFNEELKTKNKVYANSDSVQKLVEGIIEGAIITINPQIIKDENAKDEAELKEQIKKESEIKV